MKKHFWILFIAVIGLLAACNGKMAGPVSITGADIDGFDGETVQIDGAAQTFTVTVSGEGWDVASASNDLWISAWRGEDGKLSVRVTANNGDSSRSSALIIHNDDHSARLTVVQDYVKYMRFVSSENIIEPASGEVSIPISTNIPTEGVSITSDTDWMSGFSINGSKLVFTVTANPDTQNPRNGVVTVRSGLYVTTTRVIQLAMTGSPYVVNLATLNFNRYPVYELTAPDGTKVGRICREYLYKTDPITGEDLVNGVFTVAYPYYEGKVDYTRGRVWEDGSTVRWKESVDVNDRGSDHIAWFEKESRTPTAELYKAKGASTFRLEPLSEEDAAEAIQLTAVPLTVTDHRVGPANGHGDTEETFEYTVVKVGRQLWQKENFKSSRFADGTPIKTNIDRYADWQPNVPGNTVNEVKTTHLLPMCLIPGIGSSTTFDDADDGSATATAAREAYGLLYTFACISQQTIEFPAGAAASFDRTDRLSPKGWKVPSRNEFQIMLNYLQQKTYSDNESRMNDLWEKLHSTRANLTGFSAVGSRQKGPSGGYNTVLYYMTTDYRYVGGQHLVSVLRLLSGNYIPLFDLTIASAVYVRLIKEDMD